MSARHEYTAKGGTRFEVLDNDKVDINRHGPVCLSDLLEFARRVDQQRKRELRNPETAPDPLSRRTEVLAQMAATVAAIDNNKGSLTKSVAWAVERAELLLAAIEEAEAK